MLQVRDGNSFSDPYLASDMDYEHFLQWLDGTHAEWVNNKVVLMSPVTLEHADLSGFLLAILRFYVEEHHLGVLQAEPFQMKTGPDLPGRSPDVFFVATQNIGRLKKNYLDGPADVVIEIISPESRTRDRDEKFHEYQQGGVVEYWLIDPERKQAEFYHRDSAGIYRLVPIANDGIFHSQVITGCTIKLSWLWTQPRPHLMQVLREWRLV